MTYEISLLKKTHIKGIQSFRPDNCKHKSLNLTKPNHDSMIQDSYKIYGKNLKLQPEGGIQFSSQKKKKKKKNNLKKVGSVTSHQWCNLFDLFGNWGLEATLLFASVTNLPELIQNIQ
jgi:hypothetical protein